MYRSSPFRSTLNTGYITGLDVWSMYRSSPCRSTLNTGHISGLDMCTICTEAVHSVALWTGATSQVWTCVKYEPPSETFANISTTLTRFYGAKTILRLHFRGASFANSTTFPRFYLWYPANSTTLTRAPNQPGAKDNCQWKGQTKIKLQCLFPRIPDSVS